MRAWINIRIHYEHKFGLTKVTIPMGLAEELMDMGAQLMLTNIKLWNPDVSVADAPLNYTQTLKDIAR